MKYLNNAKKHVKIPIDEIIAQFDKLKDDGYIIFDKQVATIQKNNEKMIFPILQPGTYDSSTKDNCDSTAAILLAYYYDHVSAVYVDKCLIPSDRNALTKKLISYIEPNSGGGTYTTVVNGLNSDFGLKGLSGTARRTNLGQGAKTIYNNYHPIIVGVTKHPTYKEDRVDAYRVRICNLLVKSYMVNNGWGQDGIIISSQYLDGALCI